MHQNFNHQKYTIRKKVFQFFGGAFHLYDQQGNLVFYSKQKAFKLKEDIRVYTDEQMTQEVLTIHARSIIDFSAAYDVIEPQTQQRIGALKRKGIKSLFKDEWVIMDANDKEIGIIKEDNALLALLRRYLNLIPQTFHTNVGNQEVAIYKQHFNPFVFKMDIDFSKDQNKFLDRRIGIAAAILLTAIEGRQK